MHKETLLFTIETFQSRALSDNWHEREEAGFALRDLMEKYFDEVMTLTEGWVTHPSERVRRAACLACMQRKAYTTPVRLRKILRRLEKLMADDTMYVRKCCGPFVVGYLGYTYPTYTIPWLRKQAKRHDVNVRTNVAKAFSQALGRRHPAEGLSILQILANDERHRVRSAVLAALRNIVKWKSTSPKGIKLRLPNLYDQVIRK